MSACLFCRYRTFSSVTSTTPRSTPAPPSPMPKVSVRSLKTWQPYGQHLPRFFEKVYARVLWQVSRGPAVRRVLFNRAVRIARADIRSGKTSLAHRIADRIVFRKVRERLGGRLRFFISGGAALEREVAEFFWAVDCRFTRDMD